MRRTVFPADPNATIPDPERGRALPAEGLAVSWSPYWAGLLLRGDITVEKIPDEAEAPVPATEPDPVPEPVDPPKPARARGSTPPGDEPV